MTRATRMTEPASVAKAKPTRSDRRMVRNRKALLNAAEKLIAEKGLEHVTIDEIAETADLAKGTFYNYFDDKNEIVVECPFCQVGSLGDFIDRHMLQALLCDELLRGVQQRLAISNHPSVGSRRFRFGHDRPAGYSGRAGHNWS